MDRRSYELRAGTIGLMTDYDLYGTVHLGWNGPAQNKDVGIKAYFYNHLKR